MRTFETILLVAALASSAHVSLAGPGQPVEDAFQTIDESGGYRFGYNDGRLARHEERSPEGVVRGAYTYVDADGQVQIVTYTADKHNGFLVSGTNIPKDEHTPEVYEDGNVIDNAPSAVVEDTPEVAAAKATHLEAVRRAQLLQVGVSELPLPVQYTPEVNAARIEHFNLRNAEILRRRGAVPVVYVSQPTVKYVDPGTHYHPDYLPYVGL